MQPKLRADTAAERVMSGASAACDSGVTYTSQRTRRRNDRRGFSRLIVTAGLVGVLLFLCAAVVWSVLSGSSDVYQPTKREFPPLSEHASQYESVAREIERGMKERDATPLNERLDWDVLFAEATQGFDHAPELRQGFVTNLFTPGNWGADIIRDMGSTGSYRFLRVREVEGEPRIVFRLVHSDGRPDYHEYVPVVEADGKIKFVDVYVHSYGEMLSRTLRRAVIPILTLTHRSILARIFGRPDEYIDNCDKIVEISRLASANTPEQDATAVDIYNQLPPSVQQDKNLLITRLRIAETQRGQTYRRTVNQIEKDLADDPAADVLLLRHRLTSNDQGELQPSLRRMDESVGGDPYLKVIQGNLQLLDDNMLVAKLLYREALNEDPALRYAYEALIVASLRENEFGETARLLREFELKTGIRLDDLKGSPQYEDFIKTREYREWLRSRPRQTATSTSNSP